MAVMAWGRYALGGLLLGAACTDLAWRKIPNWLIAIGLGAFLAVAGGLLYLRDAALLAGCLRAGALAFALHLVPYACKSMGAGDVKLALVVGLLMGWEAWLGYLETFCTLAVLLSCMFLALGKRKPKTIPLAPVMAGAYFLYQIAEAVKL